MPQPAKCSWCNAWLWWMRAMSLRKWCILDPPRSAWRFRWHRVSQVRVLIGRCPCSRLNDRRVTLLVSGAEIVLNGLDDIWLDIFLFFEGERSSIDQLAIFVVCQTWGAGLCWGFLHLSGETREESREGSQHMINNINQFIYYWVVGRRLLDFWRDSREWICDWGWIGCFLSEFSKVLKKGRECTVLFDRAEMALFAGLWAERALRVALHETNQQS